MKRILVVEDDSGVLSLLRHVLEEDGYAVQAAATFSEARDLIAIEAPDLLVTDMVLPGGGTGTDLAALAKGKGVRSVLFTGYPEWVARIVALDLPYLLKPFRPKELVIQVNRLAGSP